MSEAGGDDATLYLGDCLDVMPSIPDQSIDVILCDPPYPEIARPYGRMTEAEWWAMMMGVCREARRVLRPSGSAVFILQPNSRKVGSMRGWLWRFMAWACDEWNMVQDAWWLNIAAMPEAHSIQGRLMRPSLKAAVWLGEPDCYRDQGSVLWEESDDIRLRRIADRASGNPAVAARKTSPGGHGMQKARAHDAIERRGGVSPLNVFPAGHGRAQDSAGGHGHPAGTPALLCDWWVRYLTPADGVVCDPFMGSGTVGLAALKRGRKFIGIERDPTYFETARARLAAHRASTPLLA